MYNCQSNLRLTCNCCANAVIQLFLPCWVCCAPAPGTLCFWRPDTNVVCGAIELSASMSFRSLHNQMVLCSILVANYSLLLATLLCIVCRQSIIWKEDWISSRAIQVSNSARSNKCGAMIMKNLEKYSCSSSTHSMSAVRVAESSRNYSRYEKLHDSTNKAQTSNLATIPTE